MLIQFGIVGCGYIAGRHLKHIVDHPGGVVRGIFDIEKSQMHDLAEELRIQAVLREMEQQAGERRGQQRPREGNADGSF